MRDYLLVTGAKRKVFIMRISFQLYVNKTNFHVKRFALSLAFNNEVHSNSEIGYCCKRKKGKKANFHRGYGQ